jgi:hypothetical protein
MGGTQLDERFQNGQFGGGDGHRFFLIGWWNKMNMSCGSAQLSLLL